MASFATEPFRVHSGPSSVASIGHLFPLTSVVAKVYAKVKIAGE